MTSIVPTRTSRFLLLAAAVVLASCGGGGGGEPTTPASIALSVSSSSASAAQGASSPVTVSLARTNFTGDVTLTAEGLPAGVTAAFAPATLSGGTVSSVVTLAAGASAATGTSTITVRATGSGVTSQTSSIALTVTATATPGYALSILPTAATLTAGASGTATVTLARTSFASDVALSASGLPTGATASFAPATTTGTTSVMTINTGAAAAGTYTVTITGSATGLANRTATLALTISAAGSSNVVFTFCPDAPPTWVGYQDGTGAWKQATPDASNNYGFNISSVGGVAIIDPTNGSALQYGYETFIYYGSAAELRSIGATNCAAPNPGIKTVNGTVAGVGTGDATIALGQGITDQFADGPFTLAGVQSGAHDLLAVLTSSTTFNATRVIVRRGLDPASGSTLPVLDFGVAEAVAPVRYALTFPGIAASTPAIVLSNFTAANTVSLPLSGDQFFANAASYLGYPGVGASDLHEVLAEIQQGTSNYRGSFSYFIVPGDRSAGLGPLLAVPTFSSLGSTPYPRLRMQLASQPEYPSVALSLFAQQSGTGSDRTVQVLMTPAYLGGVPATWDLSVPDFSGATGFSGSWMLANGRGTNVAGAAYGGDILTVTPANGIVFTFAQTYSTVSTAASIASVGPVRVSASRAPTVQQLRAQVDRVMRIAHNRRMLRTR